MDADVDLEPDDIVAQAVAAGSPAVDDIAAKLVRSRVAAALFGAKARLHVGRYELERQLGAGGGGIVFAATDPELSRRVALKLLAARGRRDQMLAEAHALARLAHPNVVPIFDVGTHEDQIFLVMELVEGGTLRTWLEAAPRSIHDILRAYRDAGAGLAAAHRAGFIHRDFKPDNALVGTGDDHRVRVVDFGLVHEGDGEARAGLGTPRYMPPEQAAGGVVTPAADQYSFCAALREAIRARKLDAEGTRADAIPRWLDDILARGLARDPAARWPSMDPLLDALALDPAARWRRRGVFAGVVALGAAAFIIGRAQSDSLPDCDGGKSELAKVWSPSVRDAIAAKLDALNTPYAREVKPQLAATLDGYAKSWSAGHLDACRVHRGGAQSDALFDRRMRCLDTAHAALGAGVRVLRETTAEGLAQAVVATTELPALPRCADKDLLSTNIAPPAPAKAAEVAAIERELAVQEVEIRAGKAEVPALEALIARARAISYTHVLAKALRLRGVGAILTEKRQEAIAPLLEATTVAFEAGDDELGIEAFARRVFAETKPHPDLGGIEAMEGIAKRLPSTSRGARALLSTAIGTAEMARGNRGAARVAFARAHAERTEVTGTMATEAAQFAYNLGITLDDPHDRDALFAETIANLTELVGGSHPMTLKMRCYTGFRIEDVAAGEAALASATTELVNLHPERRALITKCGFELAWLVLERGDAHEARRWFQTVVEGDIPDGDEDASRNVALARAHVLRIDGKLNDANVAFAKIRAGLDDTNDPWWKQLPLAEAELGLALVDADAGKLGTARTMFERVRDRLEFVLGKQPANTPRRRQLAFVKRWLTSPTGSP
jgi:eukaryotic-like serine/threonine-protein kinase